MTASGFSSGDLGSASLSLIPSLLCPGMVVPGKWDFVFAVKSSLKIV